jgi:hypothetical protein
MGQSVSTLQSEEKERVAQAIHEVYAQHTETGEQGGDQVLFETVKE